MRSGLKSWRSRAKCDLVHIFLIPSRIWWQPRDQTGIGRTVAARSDERSIALTCNCKLQVDVLNGWYMKGKSCVRVGKSCRGFSWAPSRTFRTLIRLVELSAQIRTLSSPTPISNYKRKHISKIHSTLIWSLYFKVAAETKKNVMLTWLTTERAMSLAG